MKHIYTIFLLISLFSVSLTTHANYKANSVLNTGTWIKAKTDKAGIHKITSQDLNKLTGTSDLASVRIFGNGGNVLPKMNNVSYPDDLQQVPTWIGADQSGNQAIYFYAPGMVKWEYNSSKSKFEHTINDYSQEAYYFISIDAATPKQVTNQGTISEAPTNTVSSFVDYQVVDNERNNLIHTGRTWYDNPIGGGMSTTYSFTFPNIVTSEKVTVTAEAVSRSGAWTNLEVSVNNGAAESFQMRSVPLSSSDGAYARGNKAYWEMQANTESVNVKLKYVATTGSKCWPNFVEVEALRQLTFQQDQLIFRNPSVVASGAITQFNLSGLKDGLQLWSIQANDNVSNISISKSGSTGSFKASTSTLHDFVLFDPKGSFPSLQKVEEVPNQNLHAGSVADLLIVTHPDFITEAEKLANYHRQADGMTVTVATTKQVFNEFGSGMADATAIRNFARMCYKKASGKLKYLLLFGDGTYDNRLIKDGSESFVPTYQSEASTDHGYSFVSDDYFALLDDNEGEFTGDLDIGVGRLPVSSTTQAQTVVNKIMNYRKTATIGEWRNKISIIADDGDLSLHMKQAEDLSNIIKQESPAYLQQKIYFDAYKQENTPAGQRYPAVNQSINKSVKDGVLILNYIGHANDKFLANEQVLGKSDIESWSNYNNLPIFVTATCEFSRFDSDEESAGEAILMNASGGGIGLFSTTRVVNAFENATLNQNLFRYIFDHDNDGNNLRMGDAMRLAKNATGSISNRNKRNFTLLADPALSLAFPHLKIKTTKINGIDVTSETATLKALSKVTVEGEVTDAFGNIQSDFNGGLIPSVFDKAFMQPTLGNDTGEKPYNFKLQNNGLFKGNVSVTNGKFQFSFVVPKDISYQVGEGLISYYVFDKESNKDGNGAFTNFKIGGSSGGAITDNQGPGINLFFNTEDFKSGDKTNKNPLLIVKLNDESGINTLGTGIGHDIVATIDGNTAQAIVLNQFYQADKDSYQAGTINYQLSTLSYGKHTLKLKVWDVVGNSSEKEIDFFVTNGFDITNLRNYPNPMNTQTTIAYSHNRPSDRLKVHFQLVTLDGRIISEKKEEYTPSSNSGKTIQLNSSNIPSLKNGIYLYRIILTDSEGLTTTSSARLIVHRK
ncbi:type IX secretion system sortase PorU [Prolixibacteraceae bacterium JC049]|nr:type IX secretion system sortase PorU [Prolixibacteraceae bacterium JC049]